MEGKRWLSLLLLVLVLVGISMDLPREAPAASSNILKSSSARYANHFVFLFRDTCLNLASFLFDAYLVVVDVTCFMDATRIKPPIPCQEICRCTIRS